MLDFDGGILDIQDLQGSFTLRDLCHCIRWVVLGSNLSNVCDLLGVEDLTDAFHINHESLLCHGLALGDHVEQCVIQWKLEIFQP